MSSSYLLLNQVEQVLLYIGGFGLSDLFVKSMKFTDNQQWIYYVVILAIALLILFNTKEE